MKKFTLSKKNSSQQGIYRVFKLANWVTIVISTLLILLILLDPRLEMIGAPKDQTLDAISIAVGRQVYGMKGFAGLEQVKSSLGSATKQEIDSAIHLSEIDLTNTFIYANTSGYILFVIIAFKLFGMSLQSLIFFWILLFLIGAIIFQVMYRKNLRMLFLQNSITISLATVIAAFPGAGIDLYSLTGMRGLPLLAILPTLGIAAKVIWKPTTITEWLHLSVMAILLGLIVNFRTTCLWMLLFILVFSFGRILTSSLLPSISNKKFQGGRHLMYAISLSLIASLPTLAVNRYLDLVSSDNSALHNPKSDHTLWHNALIPLASNKILFNKYFCSNHSPTKSNLDGYIPSSRCYKEKANTSTMIRSLLSDPLDMSGYQAVLRYEAENKVKNSYILPRFSNLGRFSVDWPLFDSRAKIVYLDIWRHETFNALTITLFANPIRYIVNVSRFPKYVANGLASSSNTIVRALMILIMVLLHGNLVRVLRKSGWIPKNNNRVSRINVRSRISAHLRSLQKSLKQSHYAGRIAVISSALAAILIAIVIIIFSSLDIKENKSETAQFGIDGIVHYLLHRTVSALPLSIILALPVFLILLIIGSLLAFKGDWLDRQGTQSLKRMFALGKILYKKLIKNIGHTNANQFWTSEFAVTLLLVVSFWVASITPSIVFYSLYHTIVDSVTILLALIIFGLTLIYSSKEDLLDLSH